MHYLDRVSFVLSLNTENIVTQDVYNLRRVILILVIWIQQMMNNLVMKTKKFLG